MPSKRIIARLEKENRQFEKLLDIQEKLGRTRSLEDMMPLLVSEISQLLDAERTTIFLIDWDTMELRAICAEGLSPEDLVISCGWGLSAGRYSPGRR